MVKKIFLLFVLMIKIFAISADENPFILFSFYGWDEENRPNQQLYKQIEDFINKNISIENNHLYLNNIILEGINSKYFEISTTDFSLYVPTLEIMDYLNNDIRKKKYIFIVSCQNDFEHSIELRNNTLRFYSERSSNVYVPIDSYYDMTDFFGTYSIDFNANNTIMGFGLDSYSGEKSQNFQLGDIIGEKEGSLSLSINIIDYEICAIHIVIKDNS